VLANNRFPAAADRPREAPEKSRRLTYLYARDMSILGETVQNGWSALLGTTMQCPDASRRPMQS